MDEPQPHQTEVPEPASIEPERPPLPPTYTPPENGVEPLPEAANDNGIGIENCRHRHRIDRSTELRAERRRSISVTSRPQNITAAA